MQTKITQYGCGCAFQLVTDIPGAAPDHCPAHGKKVTGFVRQDPALIPRCVTCLKHPVITVAFSTPHPTPHCGGCMVSEDNCTCPKE